MVKLLLLQLAELSCTNLLLYLYRRGDLRMIARGIRGRSGKMGPHRIEGLSGEFSGAVVMPWPR